MRRINVESITDTINGVEKSSVLSVQMTAFCNILRTLKLENSSEALSLSTGGGIWDYLAFSIRKELKRIISTDIVDNPVNIEDRKKLNDLGIWNFVKVEPEKHLPFDNDTFDLIFNHDVIEHVKNPYLFLTEQYRVLKKGGSIIVGTPNLLRPVNILRLLLGKLSFPYQIGYNEKIGNYIHIQEFNEWHLKNIFEEIGYQNILLEYCYFGILRLGIIFCRFPKSRIGRTMCHFLMLHAKK